MLMAHNERTEEIRRLVQSVRKVTVADLADRFATSRVTIRKDLETLEKEGVLLRTHGGAVLAEDQRLTVPFSAKVAQNISIKEQIARRAMDLVGDARTVLIDAGSTNLAIARLLKERGISIITNSLTVANELSTRASGGFVLLGGDWRQESAAFIGPYTLKSLDEMNADVAFIGASGFDARHGFSCQNSIESQVKSRMISRARHVYVVADSSKWGIAAFSTFARVNEVEALVTDDALPIAARKELEAAGAYVLTQSASKKKKTNKNKNETNRKAMI